MKRRKRRRVKKELDVTHLPGLGDALRALHEAKRILAERRTKALQGNGEPGKPFGSPTRDEQREIPF